MPSSTGSLLPDDDFNELQNIADQFAAARQKGPVDDWLPFVPPRDDRKHRPVLLELVKIDLEMSWRSGHGPRVEEYVERFPSLDPLPVELIVEEYRVRHLHGDKPQLEDYRSRFPDSFAEIERKVRELPAKSEPQAPPPAPTQVKPGAPAPPPAVPVEGSFVFPEGYKPIERLGHGNFGEVWKAEAPGGVEVAIKVVSQPLDNDGAQRELQALELIKKLQHPTLLSTYAFWILNNRLVVAMELADGSLRDRLKECKQKGLPGIPAEELLSYFHDAAVGLDFLHWQKVLHRDIKPENILLKKGYAKVADFGLARAQSGALMSTSFAGTPAFMAPEVWGGKINERSDQYSLAFTYAELRLGRRPLEGNDFMTVMRSTLDNEPDLGDLPISEKTVLKRALAKGPEERYESCVEFVEALERAVSPDGRTSRRRPQQVQRLKPGSETGTAKTERSIMVDESVQKPVASVSSTVAGAASEIEETPKSKPAVWKPAGAAPPPSTGARTILIAIVGMLGTCCVGFLIWYFGVRGRGPEPTTPSETTSGGIASTTPKEDRPTTVIKPTTLTPTTSKKPVEPVEDKPDYLPAKFAKAEEAKLISVDGKKYFDAISYRLKDGTPVVFRLVQRAMPGEARTFYMMENKVWNAVFAEFMQENPGQTAWTNDGPLLPARNVTEAEAVRFASWLDPRAGKLPTTQQWDHAAGFWRPGRLGPASGPNVAIKQAQPLPVLRTHDDVSPLGMRDMSGNGREFTREHTRSKDGKELVILRGRLHTLSTPLTYALLKDEQNTEMTQVQFPDKPSAYTGFRVAIELPE